MNFDFMRTNAEHTCIFEAPMDRGGRGEGGWQGRGEGNPGAHGEGSENRGGYPGGRNSGEEGGRGSWQGHGSEGGWGGHGGGHGGMMTAMFDAYPDAHVIFIGSVNCLRHKPFMGFGTRMQEGKASLLCPTMGDFSTGRYLEQLVEAMAEISGETGVKEFNIIYGCQWVILSSDADLIRDRMQSEYGITAHFSDDSHLVNGDHA